MKPYLNHDERQIVTYFAICFGMVEAFLEERSQNLSKEEITALKYSHTYLKKYIQAMVERVGEVEGDRIYRMARDNQAELRPKKYDGQLIVDKEVMIGTADMALKANCIGCNRVDYNNCPLCKFMDVLGVGSINDTKGLCEYRYEKE